MQIATWPRKGLCAFWGPDLLHPSSVLLLWLLALVATQYAGYGVLATLLVLALSLTGVFERWRRFLWRSRWLFAMLWLILAYNTPGEAVFDSAWMVTYEGMAEANLHMARLAVMLLCLAWLFVQAGRDGIVEGLWGLLHPLQRWGVLGTERVAVRLSLVLSNLQKPLVRGEWRRMLLHEKTLEGPERLELVMPSWSWRDGLAVLLGVVMLAMVVCW